MTVPEGSRERRPGDRLRFAVERQVAPHVDPQWAEAVLLELRLRGVPGARIGGVLAEVEAHCVESGEDARSAFGDPGAYARSLDLPTDESTSPRELFPVLVRGTLQALGLLVAIFGVGAWAGREPLVITTGMIVVVAGLVVAELALLRLADRLLRAAVHRSWAPAVGFVLAVGLGVAVLLVGDQEVATVPGAPVAVAGVLLIAWGQVLVLRAGVDAGMSDPVVPPLDAPPAPRPRAEGALRFAATWSVPLWTAVMLPLRWWLATQS